MKKTLLIITTIFCSTLYGQQKNEALHILFSNVDSTYFDENGTRWNEFTMVTAKAFKVMDLFEADTTLTNCNVLKGSKNYKKYLRENYPGIKNKSLDKGVFGYLDCVCDQYLIVMWMKDEYTFGLITTF